MLAKGASSYVAPWAAATGRLQPHDADLGYARDRADAFEYVGRDGLVHSQGH
jgi:hypothetical protein